MARAILTEDERRLVLDALRRAVDESGGTNRTAAESRLRLLRKLDGPDARLAVEYDDAARLLADDAVTRAVESGC